MKERLNPPSVVPEHHRIIRLHCNHWARRQAEGRIVSQSKPPGWRFMLRHIDGSYSAAPEIWADCKTWEYVGDSTPCRWCKKRITYYFSDNEKPPLFCSEDCESKQNEHVRDLYDEGRGSE